MGKFNTAFLIGRLTKAAEMTTSTKGTAIINFSIAVSESFKNSKGEYESYSNFFDITAFGNYAKTCLSALTKGREVAIQGSLHQQRWEKDGKTYAKTVIYCNELEILREPKKKDKNSIDPQLEPQNQIDDFQEDVAF